MPFVFLVLQLVILGHRNNIRQATTYFLKMLKHLAILFIVAFVYISIVYVSAQSSSCLDIEDPTVNMSMTCEEAKKIYDWINRKYLFSPRAIIWTENETSTIEHTRDQLDCVHRAEFETWFFARQHLFANQICFATPNKANNLIGQVVGFVSKMRDILWQKLSFVHN